MRVIVILSVVVDNPHLQGGKRVGKDLFPDNAPVFVIGHLNRIRQTEVLGSVFPKAGGVGQPVQVVVLVAVAVRPAENGTRQVCGVVDFDDVAYGVICVCDVLHVISRSSPAPQGLQPLEVIVGILRVCAVAVEDLALQLELVVANAVNVVAWAVRP